MTGEPWTTSAVRGASASGDFGRVIRLVREHRRVGQAQLGEACGLAQSSISRMEKRGAGTYDMQILAKAAARLQIPPGLVGLADSAIPTTARREDEHVLRRNFLAGAVATVAPLNSGPGSVTNTEEQAGSLRSVTAGFRRLDATVPARQLIDPVRAHLRLVQELAQGTGDREQRGRLAAAGSELASFAAWLSWDMADLGSARVWYGTAIGSARRAGDPVLSAYQAGSLAQLEVSSGNPAEATALLRGARRSLGQGLSAIADAWLSSLEAQALAASGNEVEAGRALVASASAAERIPGEDPAPWPWVFAFDEAKVAAARIACGVHLGRPDWVFDALRAAEPAIRSGHAKQRALLMLDIADAHLESGHVDTAFACADQAVETGIEYRSGRVIDRARRLRRRVSMTMPPRAVRRFDDRLHGVHM